MSIGERRREYQRAQLDESTVSQDPFREFAQWMEEAVKAKVVEPEAMSLATASTEGAPSARMVLLRGFDERGFVFFTDYRSQKGVELERNPRAALVFHWPELERQIRITGTVSPTSREESEAYFRTRPRGSRIGAWASHQSQVITSRRQLDERVAEMETRYSGDEIPLPPYWGGYRLTPTSIEFWQGRASRLHDRLRYAHDGERWRIERLSP
jgi:pyridoxamine 5'-phosphate oxidase